LGNSKLTAAISVGWLKTTPFRFEALTMGAKISNETNMTIFAPMHESLISLKWWSFTTSALFGVRGLRKKT